MKIEVLLFGITADIVGQKSILLEVSDRITVADFKQIIIEHYSNLSTHNSFSIAINMEYVTDEVAINRGDVVALIPPVSGG